MSNKSVWNFWAGVYNSLAAQAVSLAPTRRYVLERLADQPLAGRRILDIGCGTGQLLADMAALARTQASSVTTPALSGFMEPELWGIDYSARMIEEAARLLPKARLLCMDVADLAFMPDLSDFSSLPVTVVENPGLELSAVPESNAGSIKLEASAAGFDLITCTHSLPYYADAQKAIHDMMGLLKPGGQLLLAHASSAYVYDRLFMSLVKLTTGRAKYYRPEELAAMLGDAGKIIALELFKTRFWLPNFVFLQAQKPAQGDRIL